MKFQIQVGAEELYNLALQRLMHANVTICDFTGFFMYNILSGDVVWRGFRSDFHTGPDGSRIQSNPVSKSVASQPFTKTRISSKIPEKYAVRGVS